MTAEHKRLWAYVLVVVTFVLSIGYVVNDMNNHERDDRRIAANQRDDHDLAAEVCAYEWYDHDRRAPLDQAILDLARRDNNMAAIARVQRLLDTLKPPSCPRPTTREKP
jgi:hypothetical protein